MRYGEGLLDEILRRTDLVQLVGRRVKLNRKGRVFWGCCPFHKEKSPSFKVENERRTYHCFGCGAGGDAFKWLIETEGLSFPEAVQKLAGEAGVELPKWSAEDEEREQKKKSLYEVIAIAAQFFEDQLRARGGMEARTYLKSRGLDDEKCRRFRIGYAPDGNSALKEHLTARGIPLADQIEAGLIRPESDGRPARDFFWNRVMFPISDVRGRIVAFGGRGLSEDAKPKYINTGETSLFSKGHLLYNLKDAREAALKGAPFIVAEGYMDVIALVLAGFAGAVAPLGTALTADQLQLLWKISPEPIMCFDGDEAGKRAAARASKLALPMLEPGQSLRFVFLPHDEDPDSLLRAQGAAPMQKLIEKAEPLTQVLWAGETEGKDFSTPERRAGLEAALDALVKEIKNPKIAEYYRQDFKERIYAAFKARQAAPGQGAWNRGGGQTFRKSPPRPGQKPWAPGRPGFGGAGGPAMENVSSAVKQSQHAMNAAGAARLLRERELMALAVKCPFLIERYAEEMARFSLSDRELDRLKSELLHLAGSGARLDRTVVETHLVRQGLGVLLERLTTQRTVGSGTGVEVDEAAHEKVWLHALAQLRDPELPATLSGSGELKSQRDEALARYLDQGTDEDWNELQRLNGLIRSAVGGSSY